MNEGNKNTARLENSLKKILPKLPRAKRGKRFGLAIQCLKMDMQLLAGSRDAMDRISIKDYQDAIETLEASRGGLEQNVTKPETVLRELR